jgi:hypothetical protein
MSSALGRPPVYSDELADEICSQLADGKSLIAICKQDGFPNHKTVRGWILDNHANFFAKYARSKDFGIESLVESAFDVIDTEEDVNRARLKVDTIKWYVGKVMPKKYGDKLDVNHAGTVGLQLVNDIPRPQRVIEGEK